ncbi:MAG TPA: hypothetical protein VGJ05_18080 [Fimbriiglobus sp.]|jgi:uncharacterized protein (TIGR03066 family)
MIRTFVAVYIVAIPGLIGAAPPPKTPAKKTEKELIVGVWKRIETTQQDSTDLFLWFDAKGGMKVNRKLDGTGWGYAAKYEIKGKDLPYESTDPKFAQKETLKILKLDETEFEYADPAGIREKYKRTKEEPGKSD